MVENSYFKIADLEHPCYGYVSRKLNTKIEVIYNQKYELFHILVFTLFDKKHEEELGLEWKIIRKGDKYIYACRYEINRKETQEHINFLTRLLINELY